MRCAIYTRVSTDEQAKQEYSSLERQKEVCQHYIEIHKDDGWQVVGVYEDPGYSGKDLDRPGLQDLLDDVRQSKIDVVVTYKIDRISRSLKDFYQFWEILQQHNAKFVSATQNFDTSDSTGMLMLNILLSFAQFEREVGRERTLSKMAGRAEKGKWNGGWVPIGYDYNKENQQLVINQKEAETIRFIFKRTIETRSPSRVANEANDLGYRTKVRNLTTRQGVTKAVGGKRLDEDSIKNIVRNAVYKGFVKYKDALYPGLHPAIVDAEAWEEANKSIGTVEPRELKFKDEHIHLLKGLLHCGECGRLMTPYPSGKKDKEGKPYLYYACTSVTEDGRHSPCKIRALPAREFENLIKHVLSELGNNKAILDKCVELANQDAGKSLESLIQKQEHAEEEIAKLTRGIKRIIEVFKQEDLVSDDLKAEYKGLLAERERFQTLSEKLQIDIDRRKKKVIDAEIIRKSLQDFEKVVNLLPLDDQKQLLQLLIKDIHVYPFDPKEEGVPQNGETFSARIRTKWYKVRLRLHQLPGIQLQNETFLVSSENRLIGSPHMIRTNYTTLLCYLL